MSTLCDHLTSYIHFLKATYFVNVALYATVRSAPLDLIKAVT